MPLKVVRLIRPADLFLGIADLYPFVCEKSIHGLRGIARAVALWAELSHSAGVISAPSDLDGTGSTHDEPRDFMVGFPRLDAHAR